MRSGGTPEPAGETPTLPEIASPALECRAIFLRIATRLIPQLSVGVGILPAERRILRRSLLPRGKSAFRRDARTGGRDAHPTRPSSGASVLQRFPSSLASKVWPRRSSEFLHPGGQGMRAELAV